MRIWQRRARLSLMKLGRMYVYCIRHAECSGLTSMRARSRKAVSALGTDTQGAVIPVRCINIAKQANPWSCGIMR